MKESGLKIRSSKSWELNQTNGLKFSCARTCNR
jgi:hypothetical protein